MTRLGVALLTFCLTFTACEAIAEKAGYRSQQAQRDAAILVRTACRPANTKSLDLSAGSGVLIGPRRALTAAHVVECLGTARIEIVHNRVVQEAKVLISVPGADLALLELTHAVDVGSVRIAKAPRGEFVCVATVWPAPTYPCGVVQNRTRNRSRRSASDGGLYYLDKVLSSIIIPGNSGSGVYDDSGALVGIATAGIYRSLAKRVPVAGGFSSLKRWSYLIR